ncbi:hypothetical protein QBC35DRAFT_514493 [Podospora australis]|uniref:BZIP domain-containing protein n=1 Tax=Podospora australis TaxID=1536484 RepID=A0AAN7AJD0_9PEZI|nr:hypothetical protein QBC35DRAFT_514493 [Podospora australis]
MSYTGARRGVNVSQYLRNLNVQESAMVEDPVTEEELAKDLALFTNTQFYDFETGQNTDFQAHAVKPETIQSPIEDVTSAESIMGDFPAGFDFMAAAGDFSFGDYSSTYTSPTVPAFPDSLGTLQPIQPNPQSAYPSSIPQQHQPGYVLSAPPLVRGEKRKAAEPISPPNRMLSFEDASRVAAEEDKRRRNTAASARFRIKKKQREQALEKSAKEMTDKVTALEGRISALETENKWLKSLVTEKHGDKQELLEKFFKEFAARESNRGNSDVRDSISAASSTTAVDDSERRSTKKKD